jgi:hypothetical protein
MIGVTERQGEFMGKALDLAGQRYGMLSVISKTEKRNAAGNIIWKCRCDCGNEVEVCTLHLKDGHTQSCGCLGHKKRLEANTKHRLYHERIYKIWQGMKSRCQSKGTPNYQHYGAKGVTVCDAWQDFIPFYEWAMANGYSDDLSIDRINVYGNYEPSNCRWADRETQDNNRTDSHFITCNGKTQTITQWSRETGISYSAISWRLKSPYWTVEQALSKAVAS